MNWRRLPGFLGLILAVSLTVGMFQQVLADRSSSTNYILDGSVGSSSFGGQGSSTNYQLVSTGGESIVGNGSSGSYKLTQSYFEPPSGATSLEMTVQPANLLAYYSLDEGSGTTAYDASINNYDATLSGSPTWNGTGLIGGSITNGTAGNGIVTSETAFGNPTAFTSCAWLKYNTPTTNPTIVGRSNGSVSTDGMWTLGLNAGANPKARLRLSGTITSLIGTTTFSSGVWSQECLSYDGTTMKLYANGVLDTSQVLSLALPAVSSALSIGSMSNVTTSNYPDPIDEVKYYSRALTDAEILAEYQAQGAGVPAGLSLNTITSGTSQTAGVNAVVKTNASGYTLTANQNQDLTSGANTVPAVSGSIASPVTWVEGTTKGLGFSLVSTTGTAIPGSWSSGNAYAAFPGSATTFYTRTGSVAGVKDLLSMRLRIDVGAAQAAGNYLNTVTWTGVMTP